MHKLLSDLSAYRVMYKQLLLVYVLVCLSNYVDFSYVVACQLSHTLNCKILLQLLTQNDIYKGIYRYDNG